MDEPNARNVDLSSLRIDRGEGSRPPSRMKWRYLLWLLVPVFLFVGYRIAMKKAAPSISVEVATVEYVTGSQASAELVATGYVVAQRMAAVSSKATGRLEVLNVEEGDRVKAGEIIARLENNDIRAALDLSKANLKLAQAESTEAALNYERHKELYRADVSTKEILDGATARYGSAIATVEARRADLRASGVALENTVIRAPFNGTVLTKDADVGEMVAPFASSSSSKGSVVSIADMSSLEVEADVSESNIQRVKPNQPCEIILDAYPDYRYQGYVKKIVPTADRSRATVLTKVAFKNLDERVLPEMSARVNFMPIDHAQSQKEVKPVLAVRAEAITMRDNQKVVFRIDGNQVEAVAVQVGRELGKVTEIVSGLEAGDKVVASPPGGLKSKDKIKI